MKAREEKAGRDVNTFPTTKRSFLRRWRHSIWMSSYGRRMRDRDHTLKQGTFWLDITGGWNPHKDSQGGGQDTQRGGAASFPGGFQDPARKALSNLVWTQMWLCFEQEVVLETSWGGVNFRTWTVWVLQRKQEICRKFKIIWLLNVKVI